MSGRLTPLEARQRAQQARLCRYISNTGQVPLRPDDFDDDWSPAGEMYREDLRDAGLIDERTPDGETGEPGGIYLTPAGAELSKEAEL